MKVLFLTFHRQLSKSTFKESLKKANALVVWFKLTKTTRILNKFKVSPQSNKDFGFLQLNDLKRKSRP